MNVYVSNLGDDESGDGTVEKPFETLDYAYRLVENGDTITYRFAQDTVYNVRQLECGCKVTVDQDRFVTVVVKCKKLVSLHAEVEAAVERCRTEFNPQNESAAIQSFAAVEAHTDVVIRHLPEEGLVHEAAVKAQELREGLTSQIWSP